MYYKIRRGLFETNSSSTHSITLRKPFDDPQKDIEVDDDGYVHATFNDFGGGYDRITDSYTKLQYLLTMAWHCAEHIKLIKPDNGDRYEPDKDYIDLFCELDDFKAINDVIIDRCNCSGIIMDSSLKPNYYNDKDDYKWLNMYNDDEYVYGIDHQSEEDYEYLEEFLDDHNTTIEDFIFDDNVILILDHDNVPHDENGRSENPNLFNERDHYWKYEYKNGTYNVSLDIEDGTKIRESETGKFIPEFAESIDMNITQKCNGNCPYCYAECTPNGQHADFDKYSKLLDSIHKYTEVAINGNDLSHPDLMKFINKLHSNKVIVNMTVNEKHFIEDIKKGKDSIIYQVCVNNLIGGLGISLASDNVSDEFINIVRGYSNAVVHVICGITSIEAIDKLVYNGIKVLILGYKNIGRGIDYRNKHMPAITGNTYILKEYLKNNKYNYHISFDNLALKQLDVKDILSEKEWDEVYMGDDGEYTFYINLVDGYYAKSSLSEDKYSIDSDNVNDLFNTIRGK